jgi:hypothetical protein
MGTYESNVNMNEIISIVNGNWENNSTWNLDRVPLTSDNVILNNNHVITITTPNAVAKNLEQRTNAQIIFNALAGLRLGL